MGAKMENRELYKDECNQETVHKLASAFKAACADYVHFYHEDIENLPPDAEIEGTAMVLLTQECNDAKIRSRARDIQHDIDVHLKGPRANRWIYPEHKCCPVDLQEYDSSRACVIEFAIENERLIDTLRCILVNSYMAWFADNTMHAR